MEDQAGLKLFNLDPPQRFKAEEGVGEHHEESCDRAYRQENDRTRSALWKSWISRSGFQVTSSREVDPPISELSNSSLFVGMSIDQSKELQNLGTVLRTPTGAVVVKKGDDVAPGIFVVLAGQVGVRSAYSSSSSEYAQILKRGDTVAEDHIDLILDKKGKAKYCSSFCVIGGTDCDLLQLSQSVLYSFFSRNPDALRSYLDDGVVSRYSVSRSILRRELNIQQDEASAGRVASSLSIRQSRLMKDLTESMLRDIRAGKALHGQIKSKILVDTQLLRTMSTEAGPSTGWDVVPGAMKILQYLEGISSRVIFEPHQLMELNEDRCFVLTDGELVAIRSARNSIATNATTSTLQDEIECALVPQGSFINAATCITSESHGILYYAASRCTLQQLDRSWFNSFGSPPKSQHEGSKQNEKQRKLLFKSAKLLSRLFGPTIRQFQGLGFQEQWLSAGQAAFCQDQAPDGFFMLISGSMKFLQLAVDGSMVEKGVLRRGEWAGATGSQPCASSCLAVRDVEMVCLRKDMLPLLSRIYPRAMLNVYDKAMQKGKDLERSPGKSKPTSRTVALIPGGTPSSIPSNSTVSELQKELDDFGRKLGGALSRHGDVFRVDRELLVQHFPNESKHLRLPLYRARICRWLGCLEEDHAFLLLVGSLTDPDWTAVCSAQADRVLILGSSMNANPRISLLENQCVWNPAETAIHILKQNVAKHQMTGPNRRGPRRILSPTISVLLSTATQTSPIASKLHHPQRSLTQNSRESLRYLCQVDLVLHHDPSSIPSNAKDWLNIRPLIEHHYNVRKGHDGDIERIARWVSGNAIGVVLSGGGARGLAHVGVLQALERLQIPIDAIGGTSQGSLIGALYAQGHSVQSIYKLMGHYSRTCGSVLAMVLDLTLPILSVFNGKKFQEAVKKSIIDGPQNIEDMVTSYFCVATNLSTGEAHVYARGGLLRAVRASMSIVGLVPPIIDENGHVMCDGGYSDNLPVDAMREMGASVIIAVDVEDRNVSPWSNLSMPVEGVLSGWRILWDRWCPISSWTSGQRFPRQQHMLNALCGMAHSQNLAHLARFVQEKHIDLYLRPPVLQYALLDWNFMEDIVSDSRTYSLSEVSKWMKTTDAMFLPSHLARQHPQGSS